MAENTSKNGALRQSKAGNPQKNSDYERRSQRRSSQAEIITELAYTSHKMSTAAPEVTKNIWKSGALRRIEAEKGWEMEGRSNGDHGGRRENRFGWIGQAVWEECIVQARHWTAGVAGKRELRAASKHPTLVEKPTLSSQFLDPRNPNVRPW